MAACSSSTDMEIDAKTDAKSLPNFLHIQSCIAADLDILVDSSLNAAYKMDCDTSIQHKIKMQVRDKTLFISVDSSLTTLNPIKLKIFTPALKSLSLQGNEVTNLRWKSLSKDFNLQAQGSGDIHIKQLKTDDFYIQQSGTSSIAADGDAQTCQIELKGKGDIDLLKMPVDKASVQLSGQGDIELQLRKALNANITGVGNIYYHGKPIVIRKISGVGEIRSKDQ